MAQFGGGTTPISNFNPGGFGFGGGSPTGGGRDTNKYYEVSMDSSLKRLNDKSLCDYSVEEKLEALHTYLHDDLKGSFLTAKEKKLLGEDDKKIRRAKIITEIGKKKPEELTEKEKIYVCFEKLLDAVRTNIDTPHPLEKSPNPDKPTRKHIMSQSYTSRARGTSVFNPTNEVDRSEFTNLQFTLPPDGQPRSYPYRNQAEIDQYLKNPEDIDFEGRYGETLAFDHPQEPDKPNPKNNYKKIYDLIKKLMKKRNESGAEAGLEGWRNGILGGAGRAIHLDEYLGDTRGARQEVMGLADAYPSTPVGALGLSNNPVSSV